MTAESTPSISIEHIHATLLAEIKVLMARSKDAKTPDHSMILNFQASALVSIFSSLIPKDVSIAKSFECVDLQNQLFAAAAAGES